MRILFVDDETRVLEALERVLEELEDGWETCFVDSAERALERVSEATYDAVVSDLRMPGLGGVALLTQVAEHSPRTLRIVLSGHSDEAAALKVVHVAHQFLAKPCAATTLHQVLARAEQLGRLLPDRKLQTLAAQVGCLPSPPALQHALTQLLASDNAAHTVSALSRLIKEDPAMTAKLLQVASSAFFNNAASVADVEAAVMRLGFRTLQSLAPSLSDLMPSRGPRLPLANAVEALQRRALRTARIAASMARLPEDAATAYVAGLLCDVGQLVLITTAPERVYVVESEAAQRGELPHTVEQSTWGSTHAEIGAYLLGLWGLPFQIVEAVANHHAPERSAEDRVSLPQLVWLASCIVSGEEPQSELLHRFGAEHLYATHLRAHQAGKS